MIIYRFYDKSFNKDLDGLLKRGDNQAGVRFIGALMHEKLDGTLKIDRKFSELLQAFSNNLAISNLLHILGEWIEQTGGKPIESSIPTLMVYPNYTKENYLMIPDYVSWTLEPLQGLVQGCIKGILGPKAMLDFYPKGAIAYANHMAAGMVHAHAVCAPPQSWLSLPGANPSIPDFVIGSPEKEYWFNLSTLLPSSQKVQVTVLVNQTNEHQYHLPTTHNPPLHGTVGYFEERFDDTNDDTNEDWVNTWTSALDKSTKILAQTSAKHRGGLAQLQLLPHNHMPAIKDLPPVDYDRLLPNPEPVSGGSHALTAPPPTSKPQKRCTCHKPKGKGKQLTAMVSDNEVPKASPELESGEEEQDYDMLNKMPQDDEGDDSWLNGDNSFSTVPSRNEPPDEDDSHFDQLELHHQYGFTGVGLTSGVHNYDTGSSN
ncbi:hypothetical protein FRC11_014060, partial [Ceratobasidium sp. 423]